MSNYQSVRQLIQDGDLIAVRGNHPIDRLTSLVTHSPYTHTGVAIWLDGRLFMADLNSGRNHLTALSCLEDFDVFAPPAELERAAIRAAIFDWLASPIDYGFAAFLAIGIECMLERRKLFDNWRGIVVCSGGSVQIYEKSAQLMLERGQVPPAGWLRHTRQLSPGELASELTWALSVRAEAAP
jgi:hypothetical protein